MVDRLGLLSPSRGLLNRTPALVRAKDILTRELIDRMIQEQELHQRTFNPIRRFEDPRKEEEFRRTFLNSKFNQGFRREFGENHSLNVDESGFDLRRLFQELGPEAFDFVGHGPSRAPSGSFLKSPTHETAFKEIFMSITGINPDELSPPLTRAEFDQILDSRAQNKQAPGLLVGAP